MFTVSFVFNKVGPSRTGFRITDLTIFELEAEICINCEETPVQPPEEVSVILRKTIRGEPTVCLQELDPSPGECCDLDEDMLGIPTRMHHLGRKLDPL